MLASNKQDYQYFVNGEIDVFRQDFQNMLYGFSGVINDFPALENADRLTSRLNKAGDLINRMPTQFLYLMSEATGKKLVTINKKITDIRNDLATLPQLPMPRVLMQNPRAYETQLCQLVENRKTAVTIAVIQAKLKSAIWLINTIRGYLPDDLTMSATAVAGGGFTASIHPAQIPLKTPLIVLEAVDLVIGNNVSIAKAMCTGILPK
ncbi:hypothetical protein MNBD_GAMMA23-92 [hydrothermal vent metagenome]|uniref:Uncharacterized protein n=1 Tax=hydrothermal vent metagenome TaxID=652676 RepID=A0A3B1A1F3_9ZZZZ